MDVLQSSVRPILRQVPEGKVVKNRAHLDLRVPDVAAARDRFLALGARLAQEEPNCLRPQCWYLMADPEGNEFCVVLDHMNGSWCRLDSGAR